MLRGCNTHVDGGLGNRFGSILSAGWIAEKYSCRLNISWPISHVCAGNFESILSIPKNTKIYSSMDRLVQELDGKVYISHHDDPSWIVDNFNRNNPSIKTQFSNYLKTAPTAGSALEHIEKTESDHIFIIDNLPFYFIPNEDRALISKRYLIPTVELTKTIEDFCQSYKISKDVVGVHIRGTDAKPPGQFINIYYPRYVEQIRSYVNAGRRVLICTDDEYAQSDLVSKFGKSIIFFEKKEFVKKAKSDEEWSGDIRLEDDMVKKYKNDGVWITNRPNYNVFRSETQIKGAICDMFILAKTSISEQTIIPSTFLDFARYLS